MKLMVSSCDSNNAIRGSVIASLKTLCPDAQKGGPKVISVRKVSPSSELSFPLFLFKYIYFLIVSIVLYY